MPELRTNGEGEETGDVLTSCTPQGQLVCPGHPAPTERHSQRSVASMVLSLTHRLALGRRVELAISHALQRFKATLRANLTSGHWPWSMALDHWSMVIGHGQVAYGQFSAWENSQNQPENDTI